MRNVGILDVLLPKTRQGILAALFVRPEKEWYVSELAQRMDVPSSSLQRELHDLSAAGIIKSHRRGRMVYFQANAESPVFADLRGLLLKTAGLVDVLADIFKPLESKLQSVFIHGSIATGSEKSDSDIDIMIVGSITPMELSLPLRRATDVVGRAINPTIYTPREFAKKRAAKDHFLIAVLDKPKLFVIGNSDELGKIAG